MASAASHLAWQAALTSSGVIISASPPGQKPEKILTNVPVAFSKHGNTYLNSLGALSNLRYIGGALAIQQNYHLETLNGLDQAEVGGALDVETYPNCASDCGRSLLGDSFACLSSCQPVRTTTKCPCGGATPRPTISRKPTPQPTAAGPRPTGQPGAGTCCFDSPTGDPCKCNSIAPPDNWCAPSE